MSIEGNRDSQQSTNENQVEPRAPKKIWLRVIIYLLLVGTLGFAGWRIYQNQQTAKATNARQAAALMGRPVPVQVVGVMQQPMPIYFTALGTVMPYMTVTVKARVNGQLLPVKFTEGQEVRQGQTIMEIDPRPYQAALNQAKGTLAHDEALLKNAEAQYSRYKALYAAGVVSKESMEEQESARGQYLGAIQSDKAAIENAQLQLSWCSIQSPINGRIGLRLVDPGNIISANTTNLVIINEFRPISVYFTLPENLLPQVLNKLKADRLLPVDAYDRGDVQKLATGELLTADNQIDTTTGTAKLKAVFKNENEALFPNQFVNIHLVMEERPSALVVPSAAIQNGLQGAFVWTIETDDKGATTAKIQPVKVALAQGQVTILDSGVTAGEKIVVDGADRLRPGALVLPSQGRAPTGGPSGGRGAGKGAGQGAKQSGGPGAAGQDSAAGKRQHKEQQ
jgi:membrane fusion protein, multidrug efflux system